MKRLLSLLLPFILAMTLGAMAQSDTTPSSTSTDQATAPNSGTTQTPSTTSNDQSNSSSTMSQSGTTSSANQQNMEGCIVRQQTDYFLQPENGQMVKLNSSQDLSQHVGHHVRVQGQMENNGTASSTSTSGSNSSTSNSNSTPSANNNAGYPNNDSATSGASTRRRASGVSSMDLMMGCGE